MRYELWEGDCGMRYAHAGSGSRFAAAGFGTRLLSVVSQSSDAPVRLLDSARSSRFLEALRSSPRTISRRSAATSTKMPGTRKLHRCWYGPSFGGTAGVMDDEEKVLRQVRVGGSVESGISTRHRRRRGRYGSRVWIKAVSLLK